MDSVELVSDSEDCQDYDFYDNDPDVDYSSEDVPFNSNSNNINNDPEYTEYKCLEPAQLVEIFNKSIGLVNQPPISIKSELAQLLLHLNNWNVEKIRDHLTKNYEKFLQDSNIKASSKSFNNNNELNSKSTDKDCYICFNNTKNILNSLDCGHLFCESCWFSHIEIQLQNGLSLKIECMNLNCHLICPKEFVLEIFSSFCEKAKSARLRLKYEQMYFRDLVNSHPHLRWCPGKGCSIVIYCVTSKAHRVICTQCHSSFCFSCGQNYHAPASCDIIKKWFIKCADDSETANYISAHTKDCPNCNSCIEKNGGCNHMQCSKCKFHFCWTCLSDWKTHGSEYYECSRYKENPALAQEASNLKARRALERYLHYYERFENHNKSLKMEEELKQKIKLRIEEKISRHEGTWIDWQYLHSATHLLTKCRYTLQYTYPFAYYMEQSVNKDLFEYQQAQLEKEIEELSWKVERSTSSNDTENAFNNHRSITFENNRGDLENQMLRVELSRRTLLRDFFSEKTSS